MLRQGVDSAFFHAWVNGSPATKVWAQAGSLDYQEMSTNQDQARLIAERVARRLAGEPSARESNEQTSGNGVERSSGPRARVINFISASPPPLTRPSIGAQKQSQPQSQDRPANLVPRAAQSPWLAPFSRANDQTFVPDPQIASHPSQERFGVEEATVSELVEFFENEKQCSVDPSGKPCDHCAMCSSRGF